MQKYREIYLLKKRLMIQPTFNLKIDKCLESTHRTISQLVEEAVQNYMDMETKKELDATLHGIPMGEYKTVKKDYRMKPSDADMVAEYAKVHYRTFAFVVYQALLYYLEEYEQKQ